jgi:hypothetical protein
MKSAGIVTFLWMFLIAGAGAPGADVTGGAALREQALFLRTPFEITAPFTIPRTSGLSETALRGWLRGREGAFSWEAALESRGSFVSSGGTIGGFGGFFASGSPPERFDMTFTHTNTASTSLRTRVENLSFAWETKAVDLRVGRQPVSIGTSHFIGVLDVVAPFAPGDLDATYKPGVDAIRISTGKGSAVEAELIGVGARPWSEGALIGMGRAGIRGFDTVVVGGRFRERGFGGIAWEGEASPVGLWGEAALFERKPGEEHRYGGWSKAAFSGIAGAEFTIPCHVRTGTAVMFQDFGARRPEDLVRVYTDAPYREGWAFLGSSGYALLTLHRELHPLVNADAAGICTLTDGSMLWQPRITVSVSDNSDLTFYGWIGTGPKPRREGFLLVPRSEFGTIPDGGGVYARWFF